jgi:hypothetical protein
MTPTAHPGTRLWTAQEKFPIGCAVQLRHGPPAELPGRVWSYLSNNRVFVLWRTRGEWAVHDSWQLMRADEVEEANFAQQPKGGK